MQIADRMSQSTIGRVSGRGIMNLDMHCQSKTFNLKLTAYI